MILPTRRALALLASVAVIGLFGYVSPYALDLLVAMDVVILGAVALDGVRAVHPRALAVERVAATSFTAGRATEYEYRWRNPTRRRARLLIRETRPELLGGAQAPRAVALSPGGTLRERFAVTATARGREEGGWLALRSVGALGLGMRQGRRDLPWPVTVYPPLPASHLKAAVAEAVRHRETGLRALRHIGEGRQFESLREWVPGDDTRHIDWKATARRRKLIARQYEEERRQQVMLLIDAGRLLTADLGEEPRIEYVVQAALWLAFAANYHDDDVGVMVFSDAIHHYVAPQRGRRGLRRVLDALAVVEPRLVESDYPAALRYLAIRNRKRALTVLFTDVIDAFASSALVAHVGSLRPRHLPLVVTLRNPVLDRWASDRPTSIGDAYRKAAAEELIEAREEALAGMRRRGAIVLDTPPAPAARLVVERYLELKRRGRL